MIDEVLLLHIPLLGATLNFFIISLSGKEVSKVLHIVNHTHTHTHWYIHVHAHTNIVAHTC